MMTVETIVFWIKRLLPGVGRQAFVKPEQLSRLLELDQRIASVIPFSH